MTKLVLRKERAASENIIILDTINIEFHRLVKNTEFSYHAELR